MTREEFVQQVYLTKGIEEADEIIALYDNRMANGPQPTSERSCSTPVIDAFNKLAQKVFLYESGEKPIAIKIPELLFELLYSEFEVKEGFPLVNSLIGGVLDGTGVVFKTAYGKFKISIEDNKAMIQRAASEQKSIETKETWREKRLKWLKDKPKEEKFRGSGRSLGICLEIIGRCLQNPEREFRVYDHNIHCGNLYRFMGEDSNLGKIAALVSALELDGFIFRRDPARVFFTLDPNKS
jgi:hypothetical protein